MTLQMDLDGGGIAISGKAANFRREEGKKKQKKQNIEALEYLP